MRVLVCDSTGEVAAAAAELVREAVSWRPQAVIGWPTGRTAVPLYDELARLKAEGGLDLSQTRGFNLDELMLPQDDPNSFASFMRRHAGERIGLDPSRCDIPRSNADPAEECRRYDDAIAAAGGLDLAVLGVGVDGHVAYNLPGEEVKETHLVVVPDQVTDVIGVSEEFRPLRALTMGMRALKSARQVLVMATGERKREAIEAMIHGPADPAWPCSLLRQHPDLTLILDGAAAAVDQREGGRA